MNDGIPYADLIILALIAGFILLRLRATLGQKTGRDEADFMQRLKPMAEAREPIVQIIDKTLKNKQKEEPDAALALISDASTVSALTAIKEKDAQFTATRFIDGARMAFEMVFEAFTKGDKQALNMLLDEPLAKDFSAEIDARATQEKRSHTTLVSVIGKDIIQASLTGNMARITMKFTSEQIAVIRNTKGEIIEGNPSDTHHVVDEWVFERDVTSKEPQLENYRDVMRLFSIVLLLMVGGCALFTQPDHFGARPVAFTDLPEWQADDHQAALSAFLSSCGILSKSPKPQSGGSGLQLSAAVWQSLCDDAQKSQHAAREFFERRFSMYRVNNNGREEGLFTGYYEPVLYGAYRQYGDFQYPLYMAPPELANSERSYTHAEINSGILDGRKLEVVWVDDPVMRFFLQIQGSGRVKLTNGKTLYVGFAGKNGQPYVSIGKIMGEEGLLPKDEINFFTIRQWMYKNPDRAFALMERNPSYVFFKVRNEPGAVGAAGAVLTPARSLAVDSTYIPYGLPIYLETELPPEPQREPTPFKRLMVAQDTGGAIKGPVRADIFFGTGDEAEYMAGYMARKGVYTLLVPNEIIGQITK